MSGAPQGRFLDDGRRVHLQHGPIDLVIEAFGDTEEVQAAYRQAWRRFRTILQEIVDELPLLRQPVGPAFPLLHGPVARRMRKAVMPHCGNFITPMAAVAGSVADEILAAMTNGRILAKAYVNNGGDIALHLTPGQILRIGVVANADLPAISAFGEVRFAQPIRGIATSGWRGRSQSLGIADAATVLATNAAEADAAATMIANAVTVEHPAVERVPASSLHDDSDLGDILVTSHVGPLPRNAVTRALESGRMEAERQHKLGWIYGAHLSLQGETRMVGADMIDDRIPERKGAWT